MPFWNLAWRLFKHWPQILAEAGKARPGTWFRVPIEGAKFDTLS
jgi:hypothetical protein